MDLLDELLVLLSNFSDMVKLDQKEITPLNNEILPVIKKLAEALARLEPGVRSVKNELAVGGGDSASAE